MRGLGIDHPIPNGTNRVLMARELLSLVVIPGKERIQRPLAKRRTSHSRIYSFIYSIMAAQVVGAAVAAAVQDAQDFANVLSNVCAFTARQIDVLVNDGYNTADALYNWKYKDIREWCEHKTKLSQQRGGTPYGDRKIKCLQALAWWITDRELRGVGFNIVADFNIVELQDAIEESRLEYEESKRESAVEMPKTFTVADWVSWE